MRDLRYGVRALRRAPGFTFVAVLTLALGIGSVTVIYSVIHDVLLNPLPYHDSDRFVNVLVQDAETGSVRGLLPADEFLDYQEHSDVFEDVVGTRGESAMLATDGGSRGPACRPCDAEFLRGHGAAALAIGRTAGPYDGAARCGAGGRLETPGLGQATSAAIRASVGRTIRLNGEPRTIVGVMPPRFTWHAADLWIPSVNRQEPRLTRDQCHNLATSRARLKRGVTPQQAEDAAQCRRDRGAHARTLPSIRRTFACRW